MARALTEHEIRDVRARICAVAECQFAERGLEETSLRSIAREMGWTAASLYRYFPSKDELLSATRAAVLDRFSARIEAAYASTDDLWDRSRAVGQAYVDFAFDEPHAYQLMFAFSQADDPPPELRAAQARSDRTVIDYITDMVDAGLLEGDPRILGRAFWVSLHGLITLRMAGRVRADEFEELRHALGRLITRGARPTG